MLDVASNRIKRIENISHLTELQEFWVSMGWNCPWNVPTAVNKILLVRSNGRVAYICVLE